MRKTVASFIISSEKRKTKIKKYNNCGFVDEQKKRAEIENRRRRKNTRRRKETNTYAVAFMNGRLNYANH